MFTWHAHETAVTALAFGPGGRFLVSAGADWCVRAWDPLAGAELSCIELYPDHDPDLPPHPRAVRCWLALSSDGIRGLLGVPFHGLKYLDFERGELTDSEHYPGVHSVRTAPGGQSAIALLTNQFQNTPFAQQIAFSDGTTSSVAVAFWPNARALAFSPDGSCFAAGSTVYPWLPDNASGYHVWMKDYIPDDLAFSADNQHLFALVGGKIVVYSLPDGLFKTKLKGHNGRITAMALTPDGTRLWTASHDATVKCWDTHSLTLDRTYTFQTGGLDCLALSPDGNVAAVGSGQKGTITLWDLE